MNVWVTTGALYIIAFSAIKIIEWLSKHRQLHEETSRKAIHVGIGLLYVFCWGFYDVECSECRYYAASLPLLVTIKLVLVGLGVIKDPTTVQILCRGKSPMVLLGGPLIYGIVIVTLSVWYWLDNPIGLLAIMALVAGDGMAAIGGTFVPLARLPWNKRKSFGGLVAYWICASITSIGFLVWFQKLGYFSGLSGPWYFSVLLICTLSGLVESLPHQGLFDNFFVPLASILLSTVLL
jgi:farnesol kinase